MKTNFILILLLCSITQYSALAQASYQNVMKQHIEQLNTGSVDELQKLANSFKRIAQAHPEEWLPAYYAAYAYANIGYMSSGNVADKDVFFDEAEQQINKAAALQKNHSEIVTLKGYIMMGKLSADPANRAQRMSPHVMQTFGQALQLDPDNPRAIVLMANMELGSAQFLRADVQPSCQMAKSAIPLFEKEKALKKDDSLQPTWGMFMVERVMQACH